MERNDTATFETTDNELSADTPILFPVDKWISFGFPFTPDEQLKQIAKERIDQLPRISASIDGQPITPVRIQSPVFTLHLKRDMPNPEIGNPKNKKIAKGKYKVVTEGYWAYEKNLSPGTHVISSFASCSTGVLSLDVRHVLKVR